ncbi:ATP-binding protein [Ramlibacter rhizophilus]|uniref:ATP-binding protein n=1 Tax=Ramlibacter rhizophilus TaxID=1781167 RepID=UPI001F0D7D60|nr:ATP-binding protein [Ramlibacter rhizophilus]
MSSKPDLDVFSDLNRCAQEPIRVPGAIQPHGRMLVLSADAELLAWSQNWPDSGAAARAAERIAFKPGGLPLGEAPAPLGRMELDGRSFDVTAHRSGDVTLVEFEQSMPEAGTQAPIYSLARSFLPKLEQAHSVRELAALVANEMERLTGFGRTLVYRFDEEGHGLVLAEALAPGYDSYLDHCFPASDIPAQARELYRLNHIRLIPDALYEPVGLVSADPRWEPRGLDLSFASLRSVSPVHLEYMRNMGTLASMSVSIVIAGRLWGLVSCHHAEPRLLDFETRTACEHLGQLLGLQIDAKEKALEVETRLELRKLTLEIVSHLADGDATLERLLGEPLPLLRLADAAGAAVVLNDQCWTVGDTPRPEQITQVAQWIASRGETTYACDRIAEVFPPAAEWLDVSAGVLAISISQVHRHFVIWFRPEHIRDIRWAGEPRKLSTTLDGRIHPRKSFAAWQERVRGRSQAWTQAQVASAAELRNALIGIVLRRAEELAEVAAELGRVNRELEAFSYTVSHDLRAPMRHIAGYVDLVQEVDGKQLSDRSHRYLANVRHAAAYAGQLVDALLDFSRMGRAELKRSQVPLPLLVREVAAELARQEGGARIEWDIDDELPTLWGDPFLIQVVIRNLLGNAVKYSRARDVPRISVKAQARPEGAGLVVSDNGVGFQQKYVGKLFGVFQRLHKAEDFEGTGIGLASVRRIVERHGGIVWAEGVPDQGASFGFVLPTEPAANTPGPHA